MPERIAFRLRSSSGAMPASHDHLDHGRHQARGLGRWRRTASAHSSGDEFLEQHHRPRLVQREQQAEQTAGVAEGFEQKARRAFQSQRGAIRPSLFLLAGSQRRGSAPLSSTGNALGRAGGAAGQALQHVARHRRPVRAGSGAAQFRDDPHVQYRGAGDCNPEAAGLSRLRRSRPRRPNLRHRRPRPAAVVPRVPAEKSAEVCRGRSGTTMRPFMTRAANAATAAARLRATHPTGHVGRDACLLQKPVRLRSAACAQVRPACTARARPRRQSPPGSSANTARMRRAQAFETDLHEWSFRSERWPPVAMITHNESVLKLPDRPDHNSQCTSVLN